MRWNNSGFLEAFAGFLYFQTFVFNLQLVQSFDGLLSSSIIYVLEKSIAFVQARLLGVFYKVEIFKSTKTLAHLPYFFLVHWERYTSHKNPMVLYYLLIVWAAFYVS